MLFAETWMNLQIILSAVSQKEKDKYAMTSRTCGVWNMREMNLSMNQTHRHRGPTCGSQGGGCWRWVDWEFGVSIRKQLHLEWINTIVLLLSTESYIQCPIWTMMEKNLLKNINSLLSVTRSPLRFCLVRPSPRTNALGKGMPRTADTGASNPCQ